MEDKPAELLRDVANYYAGRLAQYGTTAQGVDWKDESGQLLRFEQLERVIAPAAPFSLNDLGSGYGAFFEFLRKRYSDFSYLGVDVAPEMVLAARERHPGQRQARFIASSEPDEVADYSVASGIFNVRLAHAEADWRDYVEATLDVLDRSSRRGFAFNCLTSYSDADRMRPDLYYADPCLLFDHCKRRYSRQVALLHDYGLYEFTIIVRKPQ